MCYDGDPCDIWLKDVVKARKSWECHECGWPIPVGVNYVRIKSLYSHEWTTYQIHVECNALWERVRKELCGGQGLIVIGGLAEEIENAGMELGRPLDVTEYTRELEAIRAKYAQAS